MSIDRLVNAMKAHTGAQQNGIGQARIGIVTGVNPNDYTATVELQPDGVQTGWLPLMAHWIGGGWGMVNPPSVGDQVVVLPQEGSADDGIVLGRVFSTSAVPPAAPSGELWIVHQSGSFLKLTNNGQVSIQDASGTSLAFQNDGTALLTGNLVVTGDISDQGAAHHTMGNLRSDYDAHTHVVPNVQPGSSSPTTTTPTPQDT